MLPMKFEHRVIEFIPGMMGLPELSTALTLMGNDGYRVITSFIFPPGNVGIIMAREMSPESVSDKKSIKRPDPIASTPPVKPPETKPWTPAPKESLKDFLKVVRGGNYLILDTETTGLNEGEICQIAIIDQDSKVWLDCLVKTVKPIPAEATRIHGITDEMVTDSPTWAELSGSVAKQLADQDVIVYNAVYDRKMMHKSDEAAELPHREWRSLARWHCAMEAYGEFDGTPNQWGNGYRWHKLTEAVTAQGHIVDNAHDAAGDCFMTLALIRSMVAHNDTAKA